MEGDFKLSLDSFYKKERDLTGIENPAVIEEELEVSGETEKTKAEVATTAEVKSLKQRNLYLLYLSIFIFVVDGRDCGERRI